MLDLKRHIVNRDLRPSRCMHECNAIDLKRGGESETNWNLRLRHFKSQPVLCDECMLLGDDLYE